MYTDYEDAYWTVYDVNDLLTKRKVTEFQTGDNLIINVGPKKDLIIVKTK